ncbi:uncharacterized protein LOC115375421 [Myripristis murdjan]|uniref:uncharacterized protein LOC115375421 n=1 Tax=Myripristis murdjan TaxID=586833 RepID=UPI001175D66A|nr:uncharacterized protein LOC115375421 [Myripristis murdjan]
MVSELFKHVRSLQGRVSSDGAGGLLQVSSGRALNASWQLCRKSPTDTVHLRPDGIALRLLRLLACRLLLHFYVTVEVTGQRSEVTAAGPQRERVSPTSAVSVSNQSASSKLWHTHLHLPVPFSTAGVAMAAQLHQDQLSLTSRTNEKVSFRCTGTDQCYSNYVYCTQVFVTALFTVGSSYWYYIFGSGTRLYVTDRLVVPPKVSIYPATRADLKGKSSLLCLATSMFPPEVQFSWRTKDNKRTIPERERVELRAEEHAAAIVLIDEQELNTYQYICSVKHQEGTVEAKIPPELPASATSLPPVRDTTEPPAVEQSYASAASIPPVTDTAEPPAGEQSDASAASIPPVSDIAEPPAGEQSDVSFQFQCRVKLLSLVSTVMIVKSMVYCCGLSLLIIHRNKGPAD